MAGRTIVVTSGKGGVGKTTTVANVGAALALRGRKVVLIDANFGLRDLDIVLGLEHRILYDIFQVFDGTCLWEEALVKDERAGELYLLSAPDSGDAPQDAAGRMQRLCEQLGERFDYILIDSPNGLESGFSVAVSAATEALVVTTLDVPAVRNVDSVMRALHRAGVSPMGLVVNRIRYSMVKRGDMLAVEDIPELLGLELLGLIPDGQEVVVAANRGTPSALKARSRPGKAFRALAARVDGLEAPLTLRPRYTSSRLPDPMPLPRPSSSRAPVPVASNAGKGLPVSADIP